jgi:hypothetical protein
MNNKNEEFDADLAEPTDGLDISWIHSHEKENNIHQNYYREPIDEITMTCIYINKYSEIEDIVSDNFTITSCNNENESVITKEELLYFIQRKKQTPRGKYNLMDIAIYCVDIEPENIQSYAKNENNEELSVRFLRTHSIFNEIVLPDSIFIFHPVNTVYFMFKERKSLPLLPNTTQHPSPVSILKRRGDKTKKNGLVVSRGKNTKKVAFNEERDILPDSSFSGKYNGATISTTEPVVNQFTRKQRPTL